MLFRSGEGDEFDGVVEGGVVNEASVAVLAPDEGDVVVLDAGYEGASWEYAAVRAGTRAGVEDVEDGGESADLLGEVHVLDEWDGAPADCFWGCLSGDGFSAGPGDSWASEGVEAQDEV